jgi:hypothetical protein
MWKKTTPKKYGSDMKDASVQRTHVHEQYDLFAEVDLIVRAVGGFMSLKVSQSSRPPQSPAMRNLARVIGFDIFCFYAKAATMLLSAEIRRILGKRSPFEHRQVELELRPMQPKSDLR